MPILSVEVVGSVEPGAAQKIADAVGCALGSELGTVWVRLKRTEAADYAENGGGDFKPVIVTVLMANVPESAELSELSQSIASAVATACGRPVENVHVVFEPPGKGRVAFGGKLLE